mmetsp:Transcript_21627/g.30933  ORF Transcript_21627/g.30933 Transcript_21627/m.30933 type:complete len:96 (-) Transcript_21627:980-1267(-)
MTTRAPPLQQHQPMPKKKNASSVSSPSPTISPGDAAPPVVTPSTNHAGGNGKMHIMNESTSHVDGGKFHRVNSALRNVVCVMRLMTRLWMWRDCR